jgi:hypothetical protein
MINNQTTLVRCGVLRIRERSPASTGEMGNSEPAVSDHAVLSGAFIAGPELLRSFATDIWKTHRAN